MKLTFRFALGFLVINLLFLLLEAKIIELNHKGLSGKSLFWPGPKSKPFAKKTLSEGHNDLGNWYANFKFSSPEHISTHLDAPYHFAEHGWSLDQIPPERFIVPAAVLDVRKKVKTNHIYRVTSSDVNGWVQANGMFPNNSVVLVLTGWSERYGDNVRYFGHANDTTKFLFPGVGIDAAKTLLKYKETDGIHMWGLGIDSPSVDYGPAKTFPVHRLLSERNIYNLENLNNLEEVPVRGATIIPMPLKIIGGSGSPCRVLALINEDEKCHNSSTGRTLTSNIFLALVPFVLKMYSLI